MYSLLLLPKRFSNKTETTLHYNRSNAMASNEKYMANLIYFNMNWQSLTIGGEQWQSIAICDILWQSLKSVASYVYQLQAMPFNGKLCKAVKKIFAKLCLAMTISFSLCKRWLSMAICDKLCQSMAMNVNGKHGTLWYLMTICGNPWQALMINDTQWHV